MRKRKYTDEFLIDELKRVASLLNKKYVKKKEFNRISKVDVKTIINKLSKSGAWSECLERAGLDTSPRKEFLVPHERNVVLRTVVLAILKRDYFKCSLCGASPANDPRVILEVDHKVPVARGGTNAISNLWTLCRDCNRAKNAKYNMAIFLETKKHEILLENIAQEIKTLPKTKPTKTFCASNLTPDIESMI